MAYRTIFELRCNGGMDLQDKILDLLAEKGARARAVSVAQRRSIYDSILYNHEPDSWYNHESDLKLLAETFPPVIFFLTGMGETYGDWWEKAVTKFAQSGQVQMRIRTLVLAPKNEDTSQTWTVI